MTLLHDTGLGNQARFRLFTGLCRAQEQPDQGQDMSEYTPTSPGCSRAFGGVENKRVRLLCFQQVSN